MYMKKALGALVVSGLLLTAGGGVAKADVGQMVDIDIQGGYLENDGAGPILTNGWDYYSSYADPSGGSYRTYIVESNGDDHRGYFTYSLDAMTAINPDAPIVEDRKSSAMAGTDYKKLYDGYMNADSEMTLSVSGLDANKSYEMVVYSQREIGQSTSLYINGSQVISNASDLTTLTQATTANGLDGNYALITSGLTSDNSGVLSFTYQGQINGFQVKELGDVQATPEPASVALLGIGGALFSLFRSRKSRAIAA